LPGACAYLSLLSISGLIDTANMFYGFLPNKSTQRQKQLLEWKDIDYAVVIYESPHRIIECINDIVSCLGGERILVIGRELTKQFETIMKLSASEYVEVLAGDKNQLRGEFVINILPIVVTKDNQLTTEHLRVLGLVAEELPPKKAVNLVHKILGGSKESMYQYLLGMK
jgi:16S rRNA (cytidine1402-2'-O)-methyltransferase